MILSVTLVIGKAEELGGGAKGQFSQYRRGVGGWAREVVLLLLSPLPATFKPDSFLVKLAP